MTGPAVDFLTAEGYDEADRAAFAAAATAATNGHGPPPPAGRIAAYDMGGLMRRGIPVPSTLNGLIYPGKMHTVSGPPEAGKTVFCLHLAIAVMQAGGSVMLMDEEAGPSQTASLLLAFGADPDMVDAKLHYLPDAGLVWDADDLDEMDAFLTRVKPKLAIYDSSAAIMSNAGISERDESDVTRFWKTALKPVARKHRCAVLVTDHDAKSDTPSRYARGSGAKLAGVDVAMKLSAMRPFSRLQDGLLALEVVKDRPGYLHRHWRVRVTRDPLELRFTKSTAADPQAGLGPAQTKIMDVITETPVSIRTLTDHIAEKFGHGFKRETMSRMLTELSNAGMVDRLDGGSGRETLWCKAGNDLTAAAAKAGQAAAKARRTRNVPNGPPEDVPPPDEPLPGGGWPEGSYGAEANGA